MGEKTHFAWNANRRRAFWRRLNAFFCLRGDWGVINPPARLKRLGEDKAVMDDSRSLSLMSLPRSLGGGHKRLPASTVPDTRNGWGWAAGAKRLPASTVPDTRNGWGWATLFTCWATIFTYLRIFARSGKVASPLDKNPTFRAFTNHNIGSG